MNILAHPIYQSIYDLCVEIEKLPASDQQTKVVVMASELEKPVAALIAEKDRLARQAAAMRAVLEWIWDDEEMGWINYNGVNECAKCGATLSGSFKTSAMTHEADCLQGKIDDVLQPDPGGDFVPADEPYAGAYRIMEQSFKEEQRQHEECRAELEAAKKELAEAQEFIRSIPST